MSSSSSKINERGFLSTILGLYVILIGIGLPLVVKNGYFDILVVKYSYYYICTIFMSLLVLGYFIKVIARQPSVFFEKISLKRILEKCTIVDYSILIYLIVSILSTITSDYRYESFWGNEGRFTGLFLIFWYVVSYFCVSRFWRVKGWYIDAILAGGIIVCLFGITDYFNLDIFRFRVNVIQEQKMIFTSTIGNINTYTSYVGIIMAISSVLFTTDRTSKSMLWHYVCVVISFLAIIMGVSDNAYLSLGALFAFLPLYLFKSRKGIRRYTILLATFFLVIQCVDWINSYYKDVVLGTDGIFTVIADSGALIYVVLGLWGLVVLWYLLEYIRKDKYKEYGNIFRYIWVVFLLLIMLFLIYILYDCNILNNTERYGSLNGYLLFNDAWGTHRGYIWRNAIECFSKFSLWKKLIGFGPETFGILLLNQTKGNPYNEIFDGAHNEYLQLLLTIGIAGLTSYVIFILSCIKRCLSRKIDNPFAIALAFGVICYSVQAFVNLNLPIVTPVFWLLLGMGTARSMKCNKDL